MPLYEYRCDDCHMLFTQLQTMAAPREGTPCPHCGSAKTRRNVSTFASKPAAGSTPPRGASCFPGGG